jgi:hypothetical protein
MKKMSFLVIGLLLMSIVAMSGCTDSKTSDTTAPAEENAGNVSANNTMPPGGENPGQMPPDNATMPPEGAPGNMSANGSMPPGGAPGNMSMPPEGAPQAENPGNMS